MTTRQMAHKRHHSTLDWEAINGLGAFLLALVALWMALLALGSGQ